MKDKVKVNIYSIFAIVMLLIIVVSAAFAYFGSFNENLNGNIAVNINAASPGSSSLVSDSSILNLFVPSGNMSEIVANNRVAAAENSAILNVTLTGSSELSTRCTYDIVFEYDLNSSVYGQSPTIKTSGADKEITFEVEGPIGETNPFGAETNIDYDIAKGWIAKTSTKGAKIKLATGARITNNSSIPNTQSWKITARYYNLEVSQSQLDSKNFVGKVYAENPVCDGTTPDAEDLIKNIAAEGEKTSSQDSSTKYLVANENGYRYEGKDPDNYICLDNNSSGTCAEDNTFRIIGVFDEKVGTSETDAKLQSVIKIIKNKNYTNGGFVWNDSDSLDWETSTLKVLLNGTYLDGLSNYKHIDKILNAKWALASYCANERREYDNKFTAPTAEEFFMFERYKRWSTLLPTYVYARVGLMNPSDYLYGVMASDCNRSIVSDYYTIDKTYGNTKECSTQNWLYNKTFDESLYDGGDILYYYIEEWTINVNEERDGVLTIDSRGFVRSDDVDRYHYIQQKAVRPTMFLDTNIELSGNGSLSNPYRIQ